MLDPEPAQNQRPPLAQPMRVVPDPNPHVNKLRLQRGTDAHRIPYKRPARIVAFSPSRGYPDTRLCRSVPMMIGVYVILRRKVSRLATRSHSYPGGTKFSSKELNRNLANEFGQFVTIG